MGLLKEDRERLQMFLQTALKNIDQLERQRIQRKLSREEEYLCSMYKEDVVRAEKILEDYK